MESVPPRGSGLVRSLKTTRQQQAAHPTRYREVVLTPSKHDIMNPTEFDRYTDALRRNLESVPEVIGLVTLGSTADKQLRDQWSDHDFWVITKSSAQPHFLQDLSWLPADDQILLKVRHSNGYTVVYDNQHKVEFAVFDVDEARTAKAERYSILIDREEIAELMISIHENSIKPVRASAEALENLCVLVWSACERNERGETLSARQYLDGFAVNQLLNLLTPPVNPDRDRLDPRRRLEKSSPDLAAEIVALRNLEIPKAALRMFEIAERELKETSLDLCWDKVTTIKGWIQTL